MDLFSGSNIVYYLANECFPAASLWVLMAPDGAAPVVSSAEGTISGSGRWSLCCVRRVVSRDPSRHTAQVTFDLWILRFNNKHTVFVMYGCLGVIVVNSSITRITTDIVNREFPYFKHNCGVRIENGLQIYARHRQATGWRQTLCRLIDQVLWRVLLFVMDQPKNQNMPGECSPFFLSHHNSYSVYV